MEVTKFQREMLTAISEMPNGSGSTNELAWKMKTSRVAIVSAGRALERRGLAVSFRWGGDRWASLCWARTRNSNGIHTQPEGREA